MNRYVLLLRGINVGGVKIAMNQLAACLQAAGFSQVHTVLATGNAVFDAAAERGEVLADAAAALREGFGREVPALLYPDHEFLHLVPESFPLDVPQGDFHRYLSFTPDAAAAARLADALPAAAGDFTVLGPVLYWFTPKGTSTTSVMATALQRLSGRHLLTTRNLNTAHRIARILRPEPGRG